MASFISVLAMGLFLCRLALFGVLHVLPSDIHPVRDAVSDYAVSSVSRIRSLATASSWAAAGGWSALGLAIWFSTDLGPARTDTAIWLVILGLILAVMPSVPTDRTGSLRTLRGRIHLILAIAWFTIAYTTITPLGDLVASTAAVETLAILGLIAANSLGALVVSLIIPTLRARTFGISERIFILTVTIAPTVFLAALLAGSCTTSR